MTARYRRARRLVDFLHAIGKSDIEWHDISWDMKRSLNKRAVHKDELLAAISIFHSDARAPSTVPERRAMLRKLNDYKTEKKPTSELSANELFKLTRKINHTEYLEAEDVSINLSGGEQIVIDDVTYDVTEFHLALTAPDEAAYETYGVVYLNGDRRRLMILHDLDKNECKYAHSVAIEEAKDYGPYKRWKKDSYVKEIET